MARRTRDVVRIKILSMGEGGVGKSCLIKRFCEQKFVTRYISTIGVDYGVKPVLVDDVEVKVNFWDLSGHPEFFEVRNEFYKDAQGALLVFDVSSRKTFECLEEWVAEARKFGGQGAVMFVVGNKTDKERVVPEAEARAWAEARGFRYWETSNKTGTNVEACFDALFRAVLSATRR